MNAYVIVALVLGSLVVLVLAGIGQLLHDVEQHMQTLQRSMDRIETKVDELLHAVRGWEA